MNSLAKVFAYVVAILFIIIAPLMCLLNQADSVIQTQADSAVQQFVDTCIQKGGVSEDDYYSMLSKLDATGYVFEVTLSSSTSVSAPYSEDITETDEDGNEVIIQSDAYLGLTKQWSKTEDKEIEEAFTTTITSVMPPYELEEGSSFQVTAEMTTLTLSQKIMRIFTLGTEPSHISATRNAIFGGEA